MKHKIIIVLGLGSASLAIALLPPLRAATANSGHAKAADSEQRTAPRDAPETGQRHARQTLGESKAQGQPLPASAATAASPQAEYAPAPPATPERPTPPADAPPAPATAEHMAELLDAQFEQDTWGSAWSSDAYSRLDSIGATLPSGTTIRDIECRDSMCRVRSAHTDEGSFQQFVESSIAMGESSWPGPFLATVVADATSEEGQLMSVVFLGREGFKLPEQGPSGAEAQP